MQNNSRPKSKGGGENDGDGEQHSNSNENLEERMVASLQILDPLLQFLTKATGRTTVPLQSLRAIIPASKRRNVLCDLWELECRGVIHLDIPEQLRHKDDIDIEAILVGNGNGNGSGSGSGSGNNNGAGCDGNPQGDAKIMVGFPPPMDYFAGGGGGGNENHASKKRKTGGGGRGGNNTKGLHGSTKTAAKRRLAALKRSFKVMKDKVGSTKKRNEDKSSSCGTRSGGGGSSDNNIRTNRRGLEHRNLDGMVHNEKYKEYSVKEQHERQKKVTDNDNDGRGWCSNDTTTTTTTDAATMTKSRHKGEMSKEAKEALNQLQHFLDRRKAKCTASNKVNNEVGNDNGNGNDNSKGDKDKCSTQEGGFVLPTQAAYAGSKPARENKFAFLSEDHIKFIPSSLRDALGLQLTRDGRMEQQSVAYTACDTAYTCTALHNDGSSPPRRRKLYSHQAKAVGAAMDMKHTLICTGTGSGKSLCFLLPVLADVMRGDMDMEREEETMTNNRTQENTTIDSLPVRVIGTSALIMFPTKALAQDQLTKLETLLKRHPALQTHIRPGIIDGDTPHPQRADIASQCNIILTNPDTLHAAILPGWKGIYRQLLARLRYIVIDELHLYEGAFGAHVSLVLSRLTRVAKVSNYTSTVDAATSTSSPPPPPSSSSSQFSKHRRNLVFIGCSATIGHPEDHFRLICPIAKREDICVVAPEEDGSPCAAKHFFVWNPPLLDMSGDNIGKVVVRGQKKKHNGNFKRKRGSKSALARRPDYGALVNHITSDDSTQDHNNDNNHGMIKRSHAADETARLLAHAVQNGIRSIAFCKTRMLAEWVYERCASILKSDESTADLASKVEIYRGGYSASIRRNIEARLFRNELIGVVGTSALELGIDIGGIDLTLHCGYPGSIASLMQQAGRAGRGAFTTGPSFAIMVCFSSPAEQHLWKHPKSLLGRGLAAPPSVPLNAGIVTSHLLCASEEFPLCGEYSVINSLDWKRNDTSSLQDHDLSDNDLFGGEVYEESLENLLDRKQVQLGAVNDRNNFKTYIKHPSIDRPWLRVSLRSIEPINYSIVDLSHPQQGGRNDGIHDQAAVMDTIPYSRVFYHAYPGAIIMHRGRRYKIHSMNSPPAFASTSVGYRYDSSNLGAYAKPTSARYSTRALSITLITIVKQFHRVEIGPLNTTENNDSARNKGNGMNIGETRDDNSNNSQLTNDNASEELDREDEEKNNVETRSKNHLGGLRDTQGALNEFVPPLARGTIAGNGVVTVKRTVHGYKKLSLVNRAELSRSEISLPPMEYDTNAIWFDTEASILSEFMPLDYDKGVHALSHAIVAVAPLFAPCTTSDLDCDHSHYDCTRVMLFDVRAGGAGSSSQLWKHFFRPNGVLEAAIDLLSECPSSCDTSSYKGGCPGCIQAVPCINFHEDLSRKAGLYIARRMLARIKLSKLYIENCGDLNGSADPTSPQISSNSTPEKNLREKALKNATDLISARSRSIVVGRPTWTGDNSSTPNRRATVEPCDTTNGISKHVPGSPQGGFLRY